MRTLALMLLLVLTTASHAAGLAGTWRGTLDGDALVLELRADGSGALNGDAIRYQQLGQQLLIEQDGELVSYFIQQRGDAMTVSGGTLDAPLVLNRGAGKAASTKTAPAAVEDKGSASSDLTGKWCYVASFTANMGGGSQSNRCFELRADGSYTYDGESSISAYSGGNAGLYGGTASSSHDEGQWSVTATQLTARSNSGTVNRYALERRNHPKNRDPMICLDGQCYATYWKKAPW